MLPHSWGEKITETHETLKIAFVPEQRVSLSLPKWLAKFRLLQSELLFGTI